MLCQPSPRRARAGRGLAQRARRSPRPVGAAWQPLPCAAGTPVWSRGKSSRSPHSKPGCRPVCPGSPQEPREARAPHQDTRPDTRIPSPGHRPAAVPVVCRRSEGAGEDTGFGTHPPLPHPQGQSVGLGRSSWGSVCRPLSSVAAGTCPSTCCPSSALAQPGPRQPLRKDLARE